MIKWSAVKAEIEEWRNTIGDDIADAIISNLEEDVEQTEPSTDFCEFKGKGCSDCLMQTDCSWK